MDTNPNEPPSNPSLSNQKRKIEKNDSIKVKRTRFCQTYHRQSFPFRAPIMKYISMNPTTPEVYQKLIKSCKHFFFQNSILIVPKLYFNVSNGWHTVDNKKIFDLNNVSSMLWVTQKIRIDFKLSPVKNVMFFGTPIIYKDDAKKLALLNNKNYFENYIVSNREDIYLDNVAITNEDDSIVPLEKMIEVSPNIKTFEYTLNERLAANIISPDTVKKLIAIPHFSNLTFLCLYSVPESFDMESFFVYVKKNKKTVIWIDFQDGLSEAYSNRLQEIVDEILETQNREYRPPWIYFNEMSDSSHIQIVDICEKDYAV